MGHPQSGVKDIWMKDVTSRSVAAKIKAAGFMRSVRIRQADGVYAWEVDIEAGGYEAGVEYPFTCPNGLALLRSD